MDRKTKKKLLMGGAVLGAIGLIWIGGGGNRDLQSVSPLRAGNETASATAAAGQEAPDFTLQAINDGGDITLSSYEGKKSVILDFFATWCPNCRRDMPKLTLWYEQYKDDVEVIGVDLQERGPVVEQYINGAGISFPVVLDPQAQAARSFGVRFTNYHVLINKDGTIAGVVPGDIQESQITELIEQNKEES